jgi:hypothetical protein
MTWKYNISTTRLGTLSDNKSFRNYRSSIDQIERIERMLALLWREIKAPKKDRQGHATNSSKNNIPSLAMNMTSFPPSQTGLWTRRERR